MLDRRDVAVEIEFLPTEQDGRSSAVRSGYRPQLYYDGHDWDASHEYPDVEEVRPGEQVRAYLTCLSPQFHEQKLVPGKAVLFREGQRVVAFGAVVSLRRDLREDKIPDVRIFVSRQNAPMKGTISRRLSCRVVSA
jgi:translation elongation factor EF-Tu-like GTPase